MNNPNSSQNKDENNTELNENTGILNANVVKPRIENTINTILKKFFESYYFENQSKENKDSSQNQGNIDKICNDVIKEVYSQFNGLIVYIKDKIFMSTFVYLLLLLNQIKIFFFLDKSYILEIIFLFNL